MRIIKIWLLTMTVGYPFRHSVLENPIQNNSKNQYLNPIDVENRTQLFIDDYIVKYYSNTTKLTYSSNKHNLPVITKTKYWEGNLNLYGSIVKINDTLKTYYRSTLSGQYLYCYAQSLNGIDWQKYELNQYLFEESTSNNILQFGSYSPNLPTGGFEIMSVARKKDYYYSLAYDRMDNDYKSFRSKNGIDWDFYGISEMDQNLPPFSDIVTMAYDSIDDVFLVCYKKFNFTSSTRDREFYLTQSKDLVSFTPPIKIKGLIESIDSSGFEDIDSYGLAIFPYHDYYLGFNWVFSIEEDQGTNLGGDVGKIEPYLVYSRNLEGAFNFVSTDPIIPLGEEDTWDDGMIFTASDILQMDDEIWMYYGGYNEKHGPDPKLSSIGLAKMRIDGFVSITNESSAVGIVQTKLIEFEGNQLRVNTKKLQAAGEIKVEMLDAYEKPIPGFTKDECDLISTDNTRAIISWSGSSNISKLEGSPIHLKFYLSDSEIYSFNFSERTIHDNENNLVIYPNPAGDYIFFSDSITGNIRVINISGQVQLEHSLIGNESGIDLSKIDSGIYQLWITNENGTTISRRIVKGK